MLEGIMKLLKHKPFYAKLFSRYDTTKNNLFGVMREQHNKFFTDLILKQQSPEFANGFNFYKMPNPISDNKQTNISNWMGM